MLDSGVSYRCRASRRYLPNLIQFPGNARQVELNDFITLTVEDQANVRADFKCQEQKMSFQVMRGPGESRQLQGVDFMETDGQISVRSYGPFWGWHFIVIFMWLTFKANVRADFKSRK